MSHSALGIGRKPRGLQARRAFAMLEGDSLKAAIRGAPVTTKLYGDARA
jgi:hypothetical protein